MAVFISYRREDTEGDARAIYNRLLQETDPADLFLDFEAISAGDDWSARISDTLDKVKAVLVIIGPRWLELLNARAASESPDLVRSEIAASLGKKNVKVIPVVVKGATLPAGSALPEDIRNLVARNAMEIRGSAWSTDVDRLVATLKKAGALPASRRSRWLYGAAALALIIGAMAFWFEAPKKIGCYSYGRSAMADYRLMKAQPQCVRPDDARWQPVETQHYEWCLTAAGFEVERERSERNRYLLACRAR